jgi:hypothetical protein
MAERHKSLKCRLLVLKVGPIRISAQPLIHCATAGMAAVGDDFGGELYTGQAGGFGSEDPEDPYFSAGAQGNTEAAAPAATGAATG